MRHRRSRAADRPAATTTVLSGPKNLVTMAQTTHLSDRRLVRELAVILVVKIMLITAIWWAFFRGEQVPVDPGVMAAQAVSPALAPRPTTAGENDAQ